jgi:hypothetical protein
LYFSVCKFAPFHRPEIERPYQEDGLGKQYYKCSTDENFVGIIQLPGYCLYSVMTGEFIIQLPGCFYADI